MIKPFIQHLREAEDDDLFSADKRRPREKAPAIRNIIRQQSPDVALDVRGRELTIGQTVVRPIATNSGSWLEVCKVTKVVGTKVYLDNSKMPMKFPDRLAVLGN